MDFGSGGGSKAKTWKDIRGTGREKVRVANALGELPRISEAFRMGEISYSKVRAITRVTSAENEDYLLMIARHGTAQDLTTDVCFVFGLLGSGSHEE